MSGDDLLAHAARALHARSAPAAGDDGHRTSTWTRVVANVRRGNRRRRLATMAALQIGIATAGVGAWAAASGRLHVWMERIGLHARDGSHPPRAPARAARSSRPAREIAVVEPGSVPIAPPPVASPTPRGPTGIRARAARPSPSPPTAETPRAAESADDLYNKAHEAHFQRRDWRAALDAWNRYLATPEPGRFVIEARYNRAVALLRLGQKDEAAAALRPFADGEYGGYRREEARALLESLGKARPGAP